MVDTILFDVDGTLLPLDAEAFLGAYLVAVGKYFAHLVDPRHMISSLLRATEEMIHNPSYYRQIVTALGRKPERCLVVGNDVQEDLEPPVWGWQPSWLWIAL